MKTLTQLRDSLDNLDVALIAILAERFKITDEIGRYKKKNHLPPVDAEREKAQFDRIRDLAGTYGLAPQIAEKVLRLVIDEVVEKHQKIKLDDTPS